MYYTYIMKIPYNRIIFALSLIGVVIAIYVTQSFVRQTSIVCQLWL